jgi:hypothetical protein
MADRLACSGQLPAKSGFGGAGTRDATKPSGDAHLGAGVVCARFADDVWRRLITRQYKMVRISIQFSKQSRVSRPSPRTRWVR